MSSNTVALRQRFTNEAATDCVTSWRSHFIDCFVCLIHRSGVQYYEYLQYTSHRLQKLIGRFVRIINIFRITLGTLKRHVTIGSMTDGRLSSCGGNDADVISKPTCKSTCTTQVRVPIRNNFHSWLTFHPGTKRRMITIISWKSFFWFQISAVWFRNHLPLTRNIQVQKWISADQNYKI